MHSGSNSGTCDACLYSISTGAGSYDVIDQELADKVVALDVGRKTEIMAGGHGNEHPETIYTFGDGTLSAKDADRFVRDWRVAGALIDKLSHTMVLKISTVDSAAWVDITEYSPNGDEEALPVGWEAHDVNTPRAINEACVEALT